MSEQKYYPEDILVEKMGSGEFGWLDYVNHYSPEWQEEYSIYCEENALSIANESAADLVRHKHAQLHAAMENGEA